jgi:glucokinase
VTGNAGHRPAPGVSATTTSPPYRDASRPLEERLEDLLARMTLPEKVGQMLQLDARDDLEDVVATKLAGSILLVVNDFAAVAQAIPELRPEEIMQIGDGRLDVEPAAVAIGPGTGLGVATVLRSGTGWHVMAGEGGHVGLSGLYEDEELEVLRVLRDELGFPSAEMVLSGRGLTRLFLTLADVHGHSVAPPESRPGWIVDRACAGTDEHCVATLNLFCQILGATAANAALTRGATGGVFLAGGIIRRFPDFLARSGFRERFDTHPEQGHYLKRIGTAVVVAPEPGLLGALHLLLDEYERGRPDPKTGGAGVVGDGEDLDAAVAVADTEVVHASGAAKANCSSTRRQQNVIDVFLAIGARDNRVTTTSGAKFDLPFRRM